MAKPAQREVLHQAKLLNSIVEDILKIKEKDEEIKMLKRLRKLLRDYKVGYRSGYF